MDRFDWKETIKPNIVMLKVVGLWPAGDEAYGRDFYTLFAVVSIFLFQVCHVFFQTTNLFFIMDDLQAVTGTIYIVLMDMAVLLKTYYVMKNMTNIKELMINVNSDVFQPKTLEQRTLVQPNLNMWKTIVSTFWYLALGCSFFWTFFPIIDKTYKNYRLPFLAWYPYNTSTSPLYEFTYLHQVLSINFTSMSNVNINTLIAALNMYVGSQFDILCDDVRNLNDVSKDNSANINERLKKCIRHHKEILKFADHVNQVYNSLLIVEFFVDGVSIGITMFQLTVVIPLSSEFYLYFGYVNAVAVEIFMYCWFGNEIEIKSSKLPYSVFESDWTGFSPEEKKNLIIFVLNVHRPLRISAFGLFYLSLETFVKIMRTAWSYFALLHRLNSQEQPDNELSLTVRASSY
ncbi:7tm 6 domain containing protein [Asbolus verrucosus]|uniref:Odorant receptor n=1 Tax=Asbolus verrucosus TaxID=1661398 RepID=A0A482W6T0_ASBVE|nr:7tm 6 domain containing protein [Asbolus verrucosus]